MSLKGSNYPTVRPSLDLQFAQTKRLDPRITYERNSVATYYDKNGILRTAQANEPRFDHDPTTGESLGLLVEGTRTNSIWPSEPSISTLRNSTGSPGNAWGHFDATTAAATRNGIGGLEVTINSTLDNNGFTGSGSTNWGGIGGGGDHAVNANARVSFFINPLTWTGTIWLGRLPTDGNTTFAQRSVSLFNNGIYNGSASYVKAVFPDGTYWLHNIPWTSLPAPIAQAQFLCIFTTTAGNNSDKFWAGGFQWEAGSFSTSYIPTTSSTVTRTADVAQITGSNFSSWYNQTEGTFQGIGKQTYTNAITQFETLIVGGSFPNRSWSWAIVAGINAWSSGTDGLGSGSFYTGLTPNVPFDFNVIQAQSSSSYAIAADGVIKSSGARSVDLYNISSLLIGNNYDGTIKRLTYWPTRLPDATLQKLTE